MILMCFVCRVTGEIKQHAVVMIVTVRILPEVDCGAPAQLPLMLALDILDPSLARHHSSNNKILYISMVNVPIDSMCIY